MTRSLFTWFPVVALGVAARCAFAQLPASEKLPATDEPLFRAEIARVEKLLETAPDKAAVTYQLARTWAAGKQWPQAIEWLGKVAGMKAGFDPSRDALFAELRSTREFGEIMATVREATPAVSNSIPAFQVREGDLVPESMAYDPKGKQFYFGSMRKGKVVRCSGKGECLGFARGLGVVLGLKVHGDGLWVLNNSDGFSNTDSALIHYELATGREIRRYSATSGDPGSLVHDSLMHDSLMHSFNDLAIAANGDVYLTDTAAGAVWRLLGSNGPSGSPALTRLAGRFEAANGIALSADGKLLYVSTFPDGITVVDLKTQMTRAITRPEGLSLAFIDGLCFHHGDLIAIQNGNMSPRVVRLKLSRDLRAVESFEVLERRNPLFGGVTTGVVAGGDFFYMANIQDEKKSGFEPITILRLRLAH
jgi:sugar lactone lactonase YvrE